MGQIYIPEQDYKVLVCCLTYNQRKYIEETLNGFAMQKTNFPFVCLVLDDCSTDGEQNVIKAWIERECDITKIKCIDLEPSYVILVPHKMNHSCTFAFYLLKVNMYGAYDNKMKLIHPWREHCEYEALCEGDDYWFEEDKLQKQVAALDNNIQAIMVYTDYKTVDERGNLIVRPKYEEYKKLHMSGDNLPNLYKTNYPLTCTVMVRKSVLESDIYVNSPIKYDYSLFLAAAFMGDFIYIEKETSCYRMNPNSLMNCKHSVVTEWAAKVREYYSYAYARGLSKKECFINDLYIKYLISKRFVSRVPEHKTIFREICKFNNSFYLFVPIVLIVKLFKKITLFC